MVSRWPYDPQSRTYNDDRNTQLIITYKYLTNTLEQETLRLRKNIGANTAQLGNSFSLHNYY